MEVLITPSQLIRDKLKEVFGSQFKYYYIGDKLDIPQVNLPCIVIEKEESTTSADAMGFNNNHHTIIIKAIVNKKDDILARNDTQLWREKLEIMTEGREVGGAYLANSIFGVLTKNITLGDRFTQMSLSAKYGLQPRPSEMLTEEAHTTIELDELIVVAGRT